MGGWCVRHSLPRLCVVVGRRIPGWRCRRRVDRDEEGGKRSEWLKMSVRVERERGREREDEVCRVSGLVHGENVLMRRSWEAASTGLVAVVSGRERGSFLCWLAVSKKSVLQVSTSSRLKMEIAMAAANGEKKGE